MAYFAYHPANSGASRDCSHIGLGMPTTHSLELTNLPYLFDRQRQAHPWHAALDEMHGNGEPGHIAVSENWRMDPRIDSKREQSLRDSGCFPTPDRPCDFGKAVQDYFSHYQCLPPVLPRLPGYYEETNAGNLIPVNERPARNHRLLHFASVNRLVRRILRGDHTGSTDFLLDLRHLTNARPPRNDSDEEIGGLVARLQDRGTETVSLFARALSDALGEREPLWWAAFASEIGDLSDTSDWTFAAQMTGLGHLDTGEWLLAWHYSPEIAGRLYRPTVAEANCNGFHFPSPPGTAYGIAMPLATDQACVRELIHPPLKGDTSAEACTGHFGRIESPLTDISGPNRLNAWLAECRHRHGRHLAAMHPATAQNWLRRHRLSA